MIKLVLLALLLLGSANAFICTNQTAPVCSSNGQNYANESAANASGQLVIYCGTCAQYQIWASSWNVYNSTTSQYNTSNRSYLERFISSGFGKIIGNDEYGQYLLAMICWLFFFTFVSFQNTRVEAKVAVMIPAFALSAYFVGWLFTLLALGFGLLIYLGLGKMFNK